MVSRFIISYEMLCLVLLPIFLTLGMYIGTRYFRKTYVSFALVGRWYLFFMLLVNGFAGFLYLMTLVNRMLDTFVRDHVFTSSTELLFKVARMNGAILIGCLSGILVSYSIDRFFMDTSITFKQSFRRHFPRLLMVSIIVSLYVTYMQS